MRLFCVFATSWMLGCSSAPVEEVGSSVVTEPLYMVVDRGERTAPEIARDLELEPSKSWEDFVDLGTAYMWQGRWLEAAEAYEVAAQVAETPEHVGSALYGKSAALAYGGELNTALKTSEVMVRVLPNSQEAAWLRYSLYAGSEDTLGRVISRDHVLRLDPKSSGHEVLDPLSTVALGTVGVAAIAGLTAVSVVALTPPEDRGDVVVPVYVAFAGICGMQFETLASPDTLDLGRKLMVEAI